VDRGFLVHNIATLRAVGLAVTAGRPLIDRPLSVVRPDGPFRRNVIAPVGIAVGALLAGLGIPYDPGRDVLVAGGMMMGCRVDADTPVNKGTTSVAVLGREALTRVERTCIRCGACTTACPLKLSPAGMLERLRAGTGPEPALRAQLETCFLCGACSAVCPSFIPLVQHFRNGKEWLSTQDS
jgi:electron transport complex protein RnfC